MTVTPPPPEVQIERTRVRVGRWTAVLVLGVTLAVVSILLYATAGFTAATSISWLSSLAALALYFEHRSARIPRIALADFMVPLAIATVLSPLYLVKVYDWPVQVGSDEVVIMATSERWADREDADLFGVSDYLGHPALLFVVWGKLAQVLGGVDLGTMRMLHGLVGLLAIAASYFLFRQLLPRPWAATATLLLGVTHSMFMVSRLAMRENTTVLVASAALALLLRGLRYNAPLPTFLGGVVAGLGYYVYQPARVTIVLWLAFLAALALVFRHEFPLRRLGTSAAVGLGACAIVAAPIVIAEQKAGSQGSELTRLSLLVFSDARELQKDWVFAGSEWEGIRTNIGYGLGAFNNNVVDHGWQYVNPGHSFVDPLTGVLVWLGVVVVGWRIYRRRRHPWALLPLTSFLFLWLTYAFLVNKAPNYTRLLITLPFVAYLVTEAIRAAAGLVPRLTKLRGAEHRRRAAALAAGVLVAAIAAWNVAIAADHVDRGRQRGDDIGNTGRYVEERRDVPGIRFYLASSDRWPYYVWGLPWMLYDRLRLFAHADQVGDIVSPGKVASFDARPPFVLFLSRALWDRDRAALRARYPAGRVRNVTPDGLRVAFEVRRLSR